MVTSCYACIGSSGGDLRQLGKHRYCIRLYSRIAKQLENSFFDYRCRLENPDDAETKAFVEAQNEVTQKFFAECETREKFRERMTALYNYPKYACPFKRGSKYFYFKNTGLQAQSVLYMVVSCEDANSLFKSLNCMRSSFRVCNATSILPILVSQSSAS
jgi:hypothetical protein